MINIETGNRGPSQVPLHDFNANRIWCQIVALASELQAWTGLLALAGHEARRWEPKRPTWANLVRI